MRRRSRAGGGEAAKTRRRKTVTLKRRNAPKTPRQSGSSAASPETIVGRLTRERDEALEQQRATAEVLKIISASRTELQPVLEVVVRSAARYCKADDVTLFELDGQDLREAAHWGALPHGGGSLRFTCTRGSVAGRVVLERKPIHVVDLQAEAENFPEGSALARRFGHRTIASVPLLSGGMAVGTLQIRRSEVNPFTDKQIALLGTFADQAVIAIENARLLNELRRRTDDLSQALQQQTATSEVLRIISSSPGELKPVFNAMLANATRICEAKIGLLYRSEGDVLRTVAMHDAPRAYVRERQRDPIVRLAPGTALGRALATKQPVQIADISKAPQYLNAPPGSTVAQFVKLSGARTSLGVPMLKDNELVGAITLYRQEVRPFTDKQIELVQNFAAQAVIAIENARLLNELRQRTDDLTESLEQQTATSNVLEVISRSAFDLQAVFETVAESAVRLCGADRAFIYRLDGELLRMAAAFNATQKLKDFISQNPIRPGRGSTSGRAVLERRTVQIPDVLADPEFSYRTKNIDNLRTVLAVPILKGDDVLGVLTIYHLEEVRLFTDKQVALLETFADQAAIAIDNVRLLDELRQSLQQQTATADVLKVISHSTFDLQAVLDTLVESATRLCEAQDGFIFVPDGDVFRAVARFGFSSEHHKLLESNPVRIDRGTVSGRTAIEGRFIHVADVLTDPEFVRHDVQKIGGFRAALGVPLLRESKVIGVIFLSRTEPQPFSEKQIELVTTFADQAVIAI